MARVKLSEFKSKEIISTYISGEYKGIPFDGDKDAISKLDDSIDPDKSYVVKVDQGVKKRFKQGLVKLDIVGVNSIVDELSDLRKKGFRHFIIEEMIAHVSQDEKYLAFERTSKGIVIYYSNHGGIDIEDHGADVESLLYKDADDAKKVALALGVETEGFIEKLIEAFEIYYFSFLEINPFVVSFKKPFMLDIAAEVDSAAEFFVDVWSSQDFRFATHTLTKEEINVAKLSEKSQASFKLDVLNEEGSIFMLLSGGGASVALADEVYNLGEGEKLANYGEYSGNPNEEETYIYTKNILDLLFKSKKENKVLIIGGGVANFTDVRITFRGIIRALEHFKSEINKQKVKIYVRRGGPHQEEGLKSLKDFMEKENIGGEVNGPDLILTDIVRHALGK